jgi:DNA-directed RNA polymerase specialized sigma24 family protein
MPTNDPHAAAYRARLDAIDWRTVFPKLTAYAHRRLARKNPQRAQELAQDAIAQLYSPSERLWDPDAQPDVLFFLCGLVNGLVANDRRRKHRTSEVHVSERKYASYASPAPSPEDALAELQERALAMAALRRHVANDEIASSIVEMFSDGLDDPAAQAARSGLSITQIRNGRKRVLRAVDAVALEMAERETERDEDEGEVA